MDEAWLFIRNQAIREYIVAAQKTWRKHNAAMILATQSIKELEESGMLDIVSESCPTKIFLANPEMNRELYATAFHLNDTELELIADLVPPGEMLIRKAQSSKKVRLNVDAVSYWIATNNARDNLRKRGVLRALRHRGRHTAACTRSPVRASQWVQESNSRLYTATFRTQFRHALKEPQHASLHRRPRICRSFYECLRCNKVKRSSTGSDRTRCGKDRAVPLAGHRSHPRQAEVHHADRGATHGEDHGSGHGRQGLLGRGCGRQLLLCASGEGGHQLQPEPDHGQGKHLQLHIAGCQQHDAAPRSQKC